MITVPRWAIFVVGMYAGAALLKLFFNRQRSRGKRATIGWLDESSGRI
jgi:hypothetical protein